MYDTNPSTSKTISLPAIYSEGAHFEDRGFIDIHTDATITWRSHRLQDNGQPVHSWTIQTVGDKNIYGRAAQVRGAYRFGSHRMARIFRIATGA